MVKWHKQRAQGMVEFALILPVLLLTVLSIIEGALLFQSYLAIQHAAREAARYAVTYQPPITYSEAQGELILRGQNPGTPAFPSETEAQWYARRVALIKQRALDESMGIRVLHPALTEAGFTALQAVPGFFGVRVQGFPSHEAEAVYDHPSLPGLPVRVEVHYRWEPVDPLIGAVWSDGVPIAGEAIMVNEGIQVGLGAVAPPQFPPRATLVPPTATPTLDGGGPAPTSTSTPENTPTPTLTPTPTSTPSMPYIAVEPWHTPWTEEELPGSVVSLHNHPDAAYSVYWTDNCGTTSDLLGSPLTTVGGWAAGAMPSWSDYLADCGGVPLEMDTTYTCTLSTSEASLLVPIYVPRRRPDLVISRVILPDDMMGGGEFVIGIEIENTGDVPVSGTFDVDIYIDPNHPPVLAGQPGLGTAGGSSPKQWVADMAAAPAPSATQVLSYVVVLPVGSDLDLWAQVDTSDQIDEEDDDNNIAGPIALSVPCSTMCDDFNDALLDGKWILSNIGTSGGAGEARIEADQLLVYGTGSSIWNGTDGKFQLVHQGAVSGDFEMTVRLTDYPRQSGAKAGLMVRESTAHGERYVAISVRHDDSGPSIQDFERVSDGATPQQLCSSPVYVSLPSAAFGPGASGVWLRIAREGSTFTRSYSLDGAEWHTRDCMQSTLSGFADPAVPGVFMAPYTSATRFGAYDDFELCPAGTSGGGEEIRPKPPGLRECGNVLTNPDFETTIAPWATGSGTLDVVRNSRYSCDSDGRVDSFNAGTYSLLFRCDRLHGYGGYPFQPWAYQDFTVPAFVSVTQEVRTELNVSLYYVVPPETATVAGRMTDTLQVRMQDAGGADLTSPVVVVHGDGDGEVRGAFHDFAVDLGTALPLADYAGETLRLFLDAPNVGDLGNSEFFVDQVRCEVCTTVQPPDPETGMAYRLGGHLLVVLAGHPTEMQGIDVWATQLPDGVTPPDQLDFQYTYSIQDSTYSFYNLRPGTYRIYAEVWVSGNQYSAVQTVTVGEGETNVDVDMTLI